MKFHKILILFKPLEISIRNSPGKRKTIYVLNTDLSNDLPDQMEDPKFNSFLELNVLILRTMKHGT